MGIIHGRNIQIFSGNSALVAAAKSCTIHMTGDTIETASASSAKAKTYTPGRTSWTIDISHLLNTAQPTGKLLAVNDIVSIKVMNGNSQLLQGTAIITDANIVATEGSLCTGSCKLLGTGELTPTSNS